MLRTLIVILLTASFSLLLSPFSIAAEHSVVYLVRHAEKRLDQGRDPELTNRGQHRADHYAEMFRDAGIGFIYSTQYKRTMDTVAPLALALKQEVIAYNPDKLDALARKIKAEAGVYFVSGHSDTTPELVEVLGGVAGAEIDEDHEFDRVYQLIINKDGSVYTHRLRSLPPPKHD
ncbi:MAG: histidine phosphatase family protein [Pseudomonadales bacterium]